MSSGHNQYPSIDAICRPKHSKNTSGVTLAVGILVGDESPKSEQDKDQMVEFIMVNAFDFLSRFRIKGILPTGSIFVFEWLTS